MQFKSVDDESPPYPLSSFRLHPSSFQTPLILHRQTYNLHIYPCLHVRSYDERMLREDGYIYQRSLAFYLLQFKYIRKADGKLVPMTERIRQEIICRYARTEVLVKRVARSP